MDAVRFIGDELSAAGWRLAGIPVEVPAAGGELDALRRAREGAELVLVTAACAAAIPRHVLEPWLAEPRPLLLVVPDLRGDHPVPDLAATLRAEMGMASDGALP